MRIVHDLFMKKKTFYDVVFIRQTFRSTIFLWLRKLLKYSAGDFQGLFLIFLRRRVLILSKKMSTCPFFLLFSFFHPATLQEVFLDLWSPAETLTSVLPTKKFLFLFFFLFSLATHHQRKLEAWLREWNKMLQHNRVERNN